MSQTSPSSPSNVEEQFAVIERSEKIAGRLLLLILPAAFLLWIITSIMILFS